MKYLCLAYESEQELNALSQEEWQALRQETLDYVDSLRSQGHLADTRPLQSARTASTVQVRSGELVMTDGPFAETRSTRVRSCLVLQVEKARPDHRFH